MTAAHRPIRDRWTAEVSAYYGGKRSKRVQRVHLIPPSDTFPRRGVPTAACGQGWWESMNAPIEQVTPGEPLPGQLTWCPKCLGVAVDQLGLADRVAALIAEAVAR